MSNYFAKTFNNADLFYNELNFYKNEDFFFRPKLLNQNETNLTLQIEYLQNQVTADIQIIKYIRIQDKNVTQILQSLCNIIKSLMTHKIIHRDFSMRNILIEDTLDLPKIYLIDYESHHKYGSDQKLIEKQDYNINLKLNEGEISLSNDIFSFSFIINQLLSNGIVSDWLKELFMISNSQNDLNRLLLFNLIEKASLNIDSNFSAIINYDLNNFVDLSSLKQINCENKIYKILESTENIQLQNDVFIELIKFKKQTTKIQNTSLNDNINAQRLPNIQKFANNPQSFSSIFNSSSDNRSNSGVRPEGMNNSDQRYEQGIPVSSNRLKEANANGSDSEEHIMLKTIKDQNVINRHSMNDKAQSQQENVHSPQFLSEKVEVYRYFGQFNQIQMFSASFELCNLRRLHEIYSLNFSLHDVIEKLIEQEDQWMSNKFNYKLKVFIKVD